MDDIFGFVKDLLTTRGAQLVSRYLAKFFVGYGVYEAAAAQDKALAVTSAVIAVVLTVADHIIHKKQKAAPAK